MLITSDTQMIKHNLYILRSKQHWNEIWKIVLKLSIKTSILDANIASEGAFALAQLGLLDHAEALAKHILQQTPNFLALRTLVLVSLKRKQPEEALKLAKLAFADSFQLITAENTAIALLTLASVHNALKNIENVRQYASESLKLFPIPNAYFLLGVTELSAGNIKQGIEALHTGLTLSPHHIDVWLLLGNTYTKLNQPGKIIQTYEDALEFFPEHPELLSTLGEWYSRIHRYGEAESLLRKTTQLQPQHVAGWINFGKLLYKINKLEESVETFNIALQLSPKNSELMFNAGQLILTTDSNNSVGRGLIKKAFHLSPQNIAIAIKYILICEDEGMNDVADATLQTLAINNANLPAVEKCRASLFHTRGHYEASLRHMATAICNELFFLKQQPSLSLFGDGSHAPMNVYDASETLLAVCDFLENLKIPYFLFAGTLLGIVRDGDLLPHDKDADLAIGWDVDREWLLQQIETSEELAINGARPDPDVAEWNFSIVRKGTPVGVDFFFQKPDGDDWLTGFYSKPAPWLQRFRQRPLTTISYRGRMLPIPENPETYLEEVYGPDWRTPMPCYDTLIAADNLCPESFLTAKIIGYNRLYEALMNRSWKKVLWYCEALKRFDNPPILDELADWLREAINRPDTGREP